MANLKSAKKNVQKHEKRRLKNAARKTSIKTAIKKVYTAIETGSKDINLMLSDVAAQLARAKSKRVIHANTASRKLSRLAKKVATLKRETSVSA
ncbi:MAG: 30S ribosomal protein S20 [candidate division TM6 bacterium GW2011_GWE2_41_16]|nr:MAG: 30S ribosomal protein S20 [candidate division TM6 bacterium GW2011_GWE2_41_16]